MPRGGRRAGAGRPRKKAGAAPKVADKQAPAVLSNITDAKEFLEGVIRGDLKPSALQMEAAKALLPFQHRKLGETGKKEQKQADAAKIAGRFAPSTPPGLLARRKLVN